MRESCIWVLVAGRNEARIYSSDDGVHELNPATPAAAHVGTTGGGTFPQFVAGILRDGAREGAFDGLILVAPPDVSRDLQHAMGPDMASLVIGEIPAKVAHRFLAPQWLQ
jgi:hypothetical protein